MLKTGSELDLALEAIPIDPGGHFGRKHLDDHTATQGRLFREKDPAHSTAAELPLDAVGSPNRRLEPL
jgi:hypothetical protein